MIPHIYVQSRKDRALTVYLETGPEIVPGDHPHFEDILDEAKYGSDERKVRDLADLSVRVAERFQSLSERVSVANGRVYFDGDPTDSSITRHIVRFLDDDVDDWQSLVAFMEKSASNPNEHSREQLYDWLNAHDFSIRTDGDIVGYKGVHKSGDKLVSGSSGTAIVDGVTINGQIPNEVGSVVEMPRQSVAHNPSDACSTGLHVGTYRYAEGFARGAMLKVAVNPRDVVSVPTDASGEKVRVCRYRVLEVIDAPETDALDESVYDWERDAEEDWRSASAYEDCRGW